MKQIIRPLLLFKKRSAVMQRVRANTYALANRLKDTSWPGGSPQVISPAGGTVLGLNLPSQEGLKSVYNTGLRSNTKRY